MTLTIELPSEIEAGLIAGANARGIPVAQYVSRLLVKQFAETNDASSEMSTAVLEREEGVWVLRAAGPIAADVVNETINSIRLERDLANLGTVD